MRIRGGRLRRLLRLSWTELFRPQRSGPARSHLPAGRELATGERLPHIRPLFPAAIAIRPAVFVDRFGRTVWHARLEREPGTPDWQGQLANVSGIASRRWRTGG
ncbi:MAG: hypothetical protein ACKOJF_32385, partial [Planctomycetaceae bacterium]